MKILIFISCIICLIWVCHGQSRTCQKQGLLCQTCNTLVNCVEEGDGFKMFPVQTCNATAKEYCYEDKCSNVDQPACTHSVVGLKCSSSGAFPDPFNCKVWHFCVGSTSSATSFTNYAYTCPVGYSYNMVTTFCDIPNDYCPINDLPVPSCKTLGESGPLKNKSIWYICVAEGKNLKPELHLCPHGKIYQNNICAPK